MIAGEDRRIGDRRVHPKRFRAFLRDIHGRLPNLSGKTTRARGERFLRRRYASPAHDIRPPPRNGRARGETLGFIVAFPRRTSGPDAPVRSSEYPYCPAASARACHSFTTAQQAIAASMAEITAL